MRLRQREEMRARDARSSQHALRDFAHLAVLCAFAIAQLLFEALKPGDLFTLAEWRPLDVVCFAIALVLLPPLALLGAELLAGLAGERPRRWLHLVFVAGLVAIYGLYIVKRVAPAALASAGVGAVVSMAVLTVAVLAALAYDRAAPVRTFLTVLSPAPLVFVLVFLFNSPVTDFVLPKHSEASAPVHPVKRPPIVMIVFDEFPAVSLMDSKAGLDRHRFPAFASLADDGTWFRNATTVHDYTVAAVPAIETGRRTAEDAVGSHVAHPDSIFTMLAGSYRLDVHEEVTRVCPPRLCNQSAPKPFPQRVTSMAPTLAKLSASMFLPNRVITKLPRPTPFPFTDPQVLLERFQRSLGSERAPTLHFLHVEFPHQPWNRTPGGRRITEHPTPRLKLHSRLALPLVINGDLQVGPAGALDDEWLNDREGTAYIHRQHIAQVRDTDRLLGNILAKLKRTHMYDRALIVVTADHGISFRPGASARKMSAATSSQILNVPLFVKRPFERRGRTVNSDVQTIDIVPTVAQLLHVRVPYPIDGRSLYVPRPKRATLTATSAWSHDTTRVKAATLERQRNAASLAFSAPIAPHQELFGRRLSRLRVAGRSRARAVIDASELYHSVKPASRELPARISGILRNPGEERHTLAIAVNGRVAAVRQTFRTADGQSHFAALLPDMAFRPGSNAIGIYDLVDDGGSVRLARAN